MNESVAAQYDRLPYPSGPHAHTHPGHTGALALLAGCDPVPLSNCRVLEIGGSDGGNLLPIALDFPDSRFVCVDISSVEIETGKQHAAALGVTNLEWHIGDLSDFDASGPGSFDYIITHGVFSWVHRDVQDRLLSLYGNLLSPRGVGFISYNTYPGWHAHMALREMMLMHVDGLVDDEERVAAALELIKRIAEFPRKDHDALAVLARSFLARMPDFESVPVYITHEFLSADNSPVYLKEFVSRAGQAGLRVFGDGDHHDKSLECLSPSDRDWIVQQSDDETTRSQYVDFIGGGAFRRSLLCHPEIAVDWSFAVEKWRHLNVSSNITAADESGVRWGTATGSTFSTEHPIALSLLAHLASIWPGSERVEEIAVTLQVPLEPVAHIVSSMFDHRVVEARLGPHRCTGCVTKTPEASQLARQHAASGYVTTQRHTRVRMDDPVGQRMLPLADGTRTVESIAGDTGVTIEEAAKQLALMASHGLLVR